MKKKDDLVHAWVVKADADLSVVEMCLNKRKSLDAACFHAQQSAEKYLKAYLTAKEIEFPFVHNLEKLIELCSKGDPSFIGIKESGRELTPYAVQARYDVDFSPLLDVVHQAFQAAKQIRDFVLQRLAPRPRPPH